MTEKLTWGQLADDKIKTFNEVQAVKKEARKKELDESKKKRQEKKPLLIPHKRQKAIKMLALGEKTQTDIADEFGITKWSIASFKKHNLEIINKERQRLLDKIPDIVKTTLELLEEYANPTLRAGMEKTLLQHAHDHTIRIMEASKIYPAKGGKDESMLDFTADKVQINIGGLSKEELRTVVMDLIKEGNA